MTNGRVVGRYQNKTHTSINSCSICPASPTHSQKLNIKDKKVLTMGGSPGVVVLGGGSCSEGRGFKSLHCILDIFHVYLLLKIVMMFV